MLRELPLTPCAEPMSESVAEFVDEGLRRAKSIDCFDFVPSDYSVVFGVLGAIPRGRFCEWGSGIGIVTGLAETLGFDAYGIERNSQLAEASRKLLAEYGLSATIETGDYFKLYRDADVYFTYCWPGQMARVEQYFVSFAPDRTRLLICHGAEDVRCKVKAMED